ncbi:MAG: PQQ-dependent sugar dehydrogenase [Planctomycetes bacterium]|nr:PQQ-dependent sugar dehydrogenase [Planctomycetota bacterium]
MASGFVRAADIAFAPNERIFVAERRGLVWIVDDGVRLPDPFIDLIDEVGDGRHRGVLGIALHPDFENTPWVYLLYVVDPIPGQPNEPPETPTFGRLTRYLADPATGGNTALLSSREVLIGVNPDEGFIHCTNAHIVGTLRFSSDGTLFAGTGDGSHFDGVDTGGRDPDCFTPPLFDPIHDIGAFRAQFRGSLAGTIIRIDPETGQGLPSNPFWTGDPQDTQSKVWVYGLRMPFRFALRPGSGVPETLYIGDVGWGTWEEMDVAYGGENFGWPCYEGVGQQSQYFNRTPAHSGCDTIETPDNPGPLTPPIITWHHSDAGLSIPPGFEGRCAAGGAFYTGHCYPPEYRGRVFFADYVNRWINVLEVDDNDNYVSLNTFATDLLRPVALKTHPITGDLYYVSFSPGEVGRIYYETLSTDSDRDCDVDMVDFRAFQICFTGEGGLLGPGCEGFDSDGDLDVDLEDFRVFQEDFTGPL